MRKHRRDFFLATKTGQREYASAKAEIHRSLERLCVDSVDLLQLHALSHPDEWDTAMGPNGALEAAKQARDQGLVRFIGVTGHGYTIAAMHRRSLACFDFDAVLMPWNYLMAQNETYRKDFESTRDLCIEKGIAVQTIKSIARGPWATNPKSRSTWYQPLEHQEDIDRAVHWVLGQSHIFLNTVGDVDLLPKVLDAATRFKAKPEDVEMEAMVSDRCLTPLFGLS